MIKCKSCKTIGHVSIRNDNGDWRCGTCGLWHDKKGKIIIPQEPKQGSF